MKRALVGLALVCVVLLLGCDQPAGGKPAPTVSAVTVSPATASIARGGSREFSAAVEGENEPDPAVAWALSGGKTSLGTGFADGVLTVGADEEADELTLTATSKADPSKSGAATVAVIAAGGGEGDGGGEGEESFVVSFNSQGGSAVANKTILKGGTASRPPDPSRAGHDFVGWYKEAAGTTAWDFAADTVTADVTLYAKWAEIAAPPGKFAVTFDPRGGSAVAAQTIASGGKVTEPAAPTKGADIFVGWYKEAALANAWNFAADTIAAATVLYAKWTAAGPVYADGDIWSAEELAKIGVEYPRNGAYRLVADITLTDWAPLCVTAASAFSGTFDGNGHTITMQSFKATPTPAGNYGVTPYATTVSNTYVGIFGYVKGAASGAKAGIKNLRIASSVQAVSWKRDGQAIGLVAGYANRTNIENITLEGSFSVQANIGVAYVGGIAGWIENGTTVTGCASSMALTGVGGWDYPLDPNIVVYSAVGGFVGLFKGNSEIRGCANSGSVTALGQRPNAAAVAANAAASTAGIIGAKTNTAEHGQAYAGGIAGSGYFGFDASGSGAIANCTSTGNIRAQAGGWWAIAGGITGGGSFAITDCAASGRIFSNSEYAYRGGISGYGNGDFSIANSRFTGTIGKGAFYAVGPLDGHANGTGAAASGADANGNTWVVPWYEE